MYLGAAWIVAGPEPHEGQSLFLQSLENLEKCTRERPLLDSRSYLEAEALKGESTIRIRFFFFFESGCGGLRCGEVGRTWVGVKSIFKFL